MPQTLSGGGCDLRLPGVCSCHTLVSPVFLLTRHSTGCHSRHEIGLEDCNGSYMSAGETHATYAAQQLGARLDKAALGRGAYAAFAASASRACAAPDITSGARANSEAASCLHQRREGQSMPEVVWWWGKPRHHASHEPRYRAHLGAVYTYNRALLQIRTFSMRV